MMTTVDGAAAQVLVPVTIGTDAIGCYLKSKACTEGLIFLRLTEYTQ